MLQFLTSLLWHPLLFNWLPDPHLILTFPTSSAELCFVRLSPLYLYWFPVRSFTHCPDDVGSTDLWNDGKLIPVYMVLQPRRRPSS
jgi:hypothetical protein